jgi:hypothetical protein
MAENLLQIGKIKGVIRSKLILKGTISKPTFIGGEEYKGAYEVTPKVEAQIMPTKDKVLIADMTVKGIEIHRVKNPNGGTTVYIAKGD